MPYPCNIFVRVEYSLASAKRFTIFRNHTMPISKTKIKEMARVKPRSDGNSILPSSSSVHTIHIFWPPDIRFSNSWFSWPYASKNQ